MIQSSGNVLLEAADKVLACGSLLPTFSLLCVLTQSLRNQELVQTVYKSHTWKIFSNKAFVSYIYFKGKK